MHSTFTSQRFFLGVATALALLLSVHTRAAGPQATQYTYDAVGNLIDVSGCTPTTCAAQGNSCGATPDGCGGTIWCACGTASTFGANPTLSGYSAQGIGALANMVSVGQLNCPVANAKVSKISVYASDAWTGRARAVIYADNSGAPGALLGTSNEVTSAAGHAWTDFTFASPVVLGAAGNYWIGVANDATKKLMVFTQSGGTNLYESINYPTIPNPWNPSNQSSSAYSKAWYATYATGSGNP